MDTVIGGDDGPAALITCVAVAGVQEVAMEENGVASLELHVKGLQSLLQQGDSFEVSHFLDGKLGWNF